jgi:hypothetical protein
VATAAGLGEELAQEQGMLDGGTHILSRPIRYGTFPAIPLREPRLIISGTLTWWLADGTCDTGSA